MGGVCRSTSHPAVGYSHPPAMARVYRAGRYKNGDQAVLDAALARHGGVWTTEWKKGAVDVVVHDGSVSRRIVEARRWGLPFASVKDLHALEAQLSSIARARTGERALQQGVAVAEEAEGEREADVVHEVVSRLVKRVLERVVALAEAEAKEAENPVHVPSPASAALSAFVAHAMRVLATTPSWVSVEGMPDANAAGCLRRAEWLPERSQSPSPNVAGSVLYRLLSALCAHDIDSDALDRGWTAFFKTFRGYVSTLRAFAAECPRDGDGDGDDASDTSIVSSPRTRELLRVHGKTISNYARMVQHTDERWAVISSLLLELVSSAHCDALASMAPRIGEGSLCGGDAEREDGLARGVRFAFGDPHAARELKAAERARAVCAGGSTGTAGGDGVVVASLGLGEPLPAAHRNGLMHEQADRGKSVVPLLCDVTVWLVNMWRAPRSPDASVARCHLVTTLTSLTGTKTARCPLDAFVARKRGGALLWPMSKGAHSLRAYERGGGGATAIQTNGVEVEAEEPPFDLARVVCQNALRRSLDSNGDLFQIAKASVCLDGKQPPSGGKTTRVLCVVARNAPAFGALREAVKARLDHRGEQTKLLKRACSLHREWHDRLRVIHTLATRDTVFEALLRKVALLGEDKTDEGDRTTRERVLNELERMRLDEHAVCEPSTLDLVVASFAGGANLTKKTKDVYLAIPNPGGRIRKDDGTDDAGAPVEPEMLSNGEEVEAKLKAVDKRYTALRVSLGLPRVLPTRG